MLSRAGVEPAAWASDLPAELNEWNIQWALHQSPLGLGKKRLRGCDVLGIAVVRRAGYGHLFAASWKVFIINGFIIERP